MLAAPATREKKIGGTMIILSRRMKRSPKESQNDAGHGTQYQADQDAGEQIGLEVPGEHPFLGRRLLVHEDLLGWNRGE